MIDMTASNSLVQIGPDSRTMSKLFYYFIGSHLQLITKVLTLIARECCFGTEFLGGSFNSFISTTPTLEAIYQVDCK